MDTAAATEELDRLLDAIGYHMTEARTAGLSDPEGVRAALRAAKQKLGEADSLVSHVAAERNKS